MSIINQALKKAQREQELTVGDTTWSLPTSGDAVTPRRRSQTLWIVTAALFALSLGATLHAWLASPTAQVEPASEPVQPAADPVLESQFGQPLKDVETALKTARQVAGSVSGRRPPQPTAPGVTPVHAVQLAAARRPTPPASAADYTARGNTFYRQGEYERAVDMYQAALDLEPLDVKARNNLGSTYLQLAMDERALAAFQEALRLDSSYGLAHYNLACVHGRAGNVERAVEYLRRAVAIEPEAHAWARTDGDFAPVRNAPEFRRLLEP